MIIDERMIAFIQSLDKGNTPFLTELEEEANRTDVPIIRPAMQSLMRFLLKLQQMKSLKRNQLRRKLRLRRRLNNENL